jgi:pyridoxine 5-phosphate synthase
MKNKKTAKLGVNIDHIATLRQARRSFYPDPFESLKTLRKTKVSHVTVHLREDRRHIQDYDVKRLLKESKFPVNFELSFNKEIVALACALKPRITTLVPEDRQEITTEGGLDCVKHFTKLKRTIAQLQKSKVPVSVFVDPDPQQILKAKEAGADAIELHTGEYGHATENYFLKNKTYKIVKSKPLASKVLKELDRLKKAAEFGASEKISVYAGHGLHKDNLKPLAKVKEIEEFNIGHAIIARSVFVGLEKAILEIQNILKSS